MDNDGPEAGHMVRIGVSRTAQQGTTSSEDGEARAASKIAAEKKVIE